MPALFDPARHEAIGDTPWSESGALRAIERIGAAAEAEFDEADGSWLLHPQDEPPQPGARSCNLYWGATGVVWALQHLRAQAACMPGRDYLPWLAHYPDRVREEAAGEQHGSASYLFGESAPLLLAWLAAPRGDFADRLHAVVEANLHNPALEPLWGNPGTVLAAIRMAEATGDERWNSLVRQAALALVDDMSVDPDTGTWIWQQDLYGRRTRYLGAGHGLAGNAYAVLRAAGCVDATVVQLVEQRVLETLSATAVHATLEEPGGQVRLTNWPVLVDEARVATWLVQDCHGAPGIVCRLAGTPRTQAWDELLRGAGELTWHAGPLAKGPSLCHGTAGSAIACLKLFRRFGEPQWLERARRLAMHAAAQVEEARLRHGQGRHSLWTGDLGVACVLWSCVAGSDGFPTLDRF